MRWLRRPAEGGPWTPPPLHVAHTLTRTLILTRTAVAAMFYDNSPVPKPSAFSTTLHHGFFTWANQTT